MAASEARQLRQEETLDPVSVVWGLTKVILAAQG